MGLVARPFARHALLLGAVAALIYFCLCWLPFQLPPTRRLTSASYTFGYNNAVAVVALAVLLGGAVLYCLVQQPPACRPRVDFPNDSAANGLPLWLFALLAGLYAGLTVALYAYTRDAPSARLTWESRHFLYRLKLMDVYGLRPYTDFQAEYGPGLTHTPAYSYRLLQSLGASHESAYFVCHLVFNVAGLWCLFYVTGHAAGPIVLRAVTFLVLAVAGFAPYMGLNGVTLRYLCPYTCLLLGHRALARLRPRPACVRWPLAFGVVVSLFLVNFLLSPEVGVAFALAWLAYGGLAARHDGGVLLLSLLAASGAGVVCRLGLPEAYYASLLRFSQGAGNLPVLPAAHLVLYVLTLFLIVPPLLTGGLDRASPTAPLLGALGVLCAVMIPGALGRCDPPHVLFYGMGASLLLMLRLANISRRAFGLYAGAYVAVFIVQMQVMNLVVFYDFSPRALLSRGAWHHLSAQLRGTQATEDPGDLSALDKYPQLGVPFATYGADARVEAYLFSRRKLAPEYYLGTVGVYGDAELARKLADVSRHEYLLVYRGWESPWQRDLCRRQLNSIRRWFLFPVNLPCQQAALDSDAEVNRLIAVGYRPVEFVGPHVVLRRLDPSPRSALGPR
jgi:hypothetical protein